MSWRSIVENVEVCLLRTSNNRVWYNLEPEAESVTEFNTNKEISRGDDLRGA